jgi:hypothetical protein
MSALLLSLNKELTNPKHKRNHLVLPSYGFIKAEPLMASVFT